MEHDEFIEQMIIKYKEKGYTYRQDFVGEYVFLYNPETYMKVRIYYDSGNIFEYK